MSVPIKMCPRVEPVSREEVLRYAGVRTAKGSYIEPEINELLNSSLKEAEGVLSLRVCYLEFPIEKREGALSLGFALTASKTLEGVLHGCERVIIASASVGMALDRLISRYSSLMPSRAHIISAIGTERVEALLDAFSREIAREEKKNGYVLTPRVSAGYGDIPLELQKDIFRVLDCERQIGVCLSDSLMMSPSKSVTAIIGVRKI